MSAETAKKKYDSIAVIGGGIGGLATANALLAKPSLVDRVTVYERAAEFYPNAGAGFGFYPNGQICLSSIGIEGYHQIYNKFESIARITKEGTAIKHKNNVFQQLRERHGFSVEGCLRADLVDLLVTHLEQKAPDTLQYSQELIKITPDKDKVELEFASGRQDVVDLVIGADGINSTVAKQLDIDETVPPIYSGANIIYGKIPKPQQIEYFRKTEIFTPGNLVNGPGTGHFIGFYAGAGEKKTFLWANTYSSDSPPKRDEWNRGTPDEIVNVLKKYPGGHPIHDLASMTAVEDLLHFPLYFRHHKSSWTHGRVTLLGDSCHATLPYVGQGANQAIEDAITLANCLEHHKTYEEAYQEYYGKRFPRTKRIVQIAGIMDKLYHSENWFIQQVKELFMKSLIMGGPMFKKLENEILEECPVKDYKKYAPQTP